MEEGEEDEPTRIPEDNFGKEIIREDAFLKRDVKEFIRLIQEFNKSPHSEKEYRDKINQLAGDELI